MTIAKEILKEKSGYTEITIEANKQKIEVEQDYDNEMTTFIFEDGSELKCSAIDYSCVSN